MSITIIGAGISGLILGRCLLQRGIPTILLEKNSQTTFAKRNNYSITLHRHAYQPLLTLLGLDEARFRRKVGLGGGQGGDLRVNRNRFETWLVEGLDVRWEREVGGIDVGGALKVKGKAGEEMEMGRSKVVVGADGPHSIVRRSMAPEAELEVLPFAVYNGRRRISGAELGGEGEVVEQRVGDALFRVLVSERMEDEGVGVSYTYSRPARGGEDGLFRPEREKGDAKRIPRELFEEVDGAREKLREPLRRVFDTGKMREDRLLNWLMRTVEVDGETLREAGKKGIVLMGDAVHAEPILGGEGANVAIEDGMRLAALLESNDNAISQFYDDRWEVWTRSVDESRARISDMHAAARSSL